VNVLVWNHLATQIKRVGNQRLALCPTSKLPLPGKTAKTTAAFINLLEDCKTLAYISCVLPRRSLSVVLVLVVCIPCAFGQLPKRLEKCLPYPTLAQEIRAMQPARPAPPRVKVHVTRVEFDPNDGIPADAQEEISGKLQGRMFEPALDSAYLNDLENEIADVGVRGTLRDRGYFKVTATAKLTPLWREGIDISVVVIVSATLGLQYRTGDIRIESADESNPLVISPEVLRGLIPLQRGELFSVESVRTGLENLGRAYGREGYVDMTPEPDTEVDEARGVVDLVVRVDQQVQYRVGSIEFLGVNAVARDKLQESLPKPGEVFDSSKLNEFFKVNRAILPEDASRDDVNVRRDNKMRTVKILFDFRVCPQHSN
jgi:outer membrane protein assembly factor BamA